MVLEKQTSLSCADSIDGNATYDSLEEIHVLALAYVLRRPIIVISDIVLRDINGEALAPITFGGVYLPLDIPQSECHKVPLLLAYDTAHFSALVTMEASSDFPPALIPLIDNENILLPIQFCIDPGANFNWRDYDGREGNWALTEVEHIALLKEYLEISYASPAASPEDEIYEDYQSDEEYDKKMLDIAINLNNEENNLTGSSSSPEFEGSSKAQKSKSAKLQSVAKQFGSIGKSMSKKIKKNIGSITKFGKSSCTGSKFPVSPSTSTPTLGGAYVNGKYRLLCAQLRAKRHDYQDEMIKNYLDCAYERFALEMRNNMAKDKEPSDSGRIVHCINSDCDNFGSEKTSWMCLTCYDKQKQRESSQVEFDYTYQPPRYGTGNSKFYTQSDVNSHNSVKRLPSVKKLNELDQTLYLSKSTFFNDTKLIPHNTLGIPQSPPAPAVGKTTIIPIRIEGRSEDVIPNDLIQFSGSDRIEPLHQANINGHASIDSSPTASVCSNYYTPREIKSPSINGMKALTSDHVDGPVRKSYDLATKCRTLGCNFFGSPESGYCSKCCQEHKVQIQQYRKLQTEI